MSELVQRINAAQWKINHGLRHNLHERVLDVHWQEWSKLRGLYGEDALLRSFSQYHEVVGSMCPLQDSAIQRVGFQAAILDIKI